MSHTPRNWQTKALETIKEKWAGNPAARPLVAACPGSGKTYLATCASKHALDMGLVDVVLVVCPSVTIKWQWVEDFRALSIKAHARADNEALRFRRDTGAHRTGGWTVLCVTYQQISKDVELFTEIARAHRVLLIADEVHHADDNEAFGRALSSLSDQCTLRLALSGTPFNTSGSALAMVESKPGVNDEGRPVNESVSTVSYSYGDALIEPTADVCRPVEFTKVYGKNEANYRNLTDNSRFKKLTDLSRQNKSDSIGLFLDPKDEYMEECVRQSLTALSELQEHDKSAGMLVVAKDTTHGHELVALIERMKRGRPEWRRFSIVEVYNDTQKAHERIQALNHDRTDIVVTVRMISEGVDIKRLRVGMYATDYLTRMFFIQFVGRFVRYESRLDAMQHARVIIPAHVILLGYAREIEQMVIAAIIAEAAKEGGEPPPAPTSERIGSESKPDRVGAILRGEDCDDMELAEAFIAEHDLRGQCPPALAAKIAKAVNFKGAARAPAPEVEIDWGKKNDDMVRRVVRAMPVNGEPDGVLYARVNGKANAHVGIARKDAMTSPEVLQRRYQFLRAWLIILLKGEESNE